MKWLYKKNLVSDLGYQWSLPSQPAGHRGRRCWGCPNSSPQTHHSCCWMGQVCFLFLNYDYQVYFWQLLLKVFYQSPAYYYRCNNYVDKRKPFTKKIITLTSQLSGPLIGSNGLISCKILNMMSQLAHYVAVTRSIQWETTISVLLFSVCCFQ